MTENRSAQSWIRPAIFQALVGVAVWMTFGMLLEGLIGYKTPLYLQDPVRRELFRLAHAHGTLLSLLLLGVALVCDRFELNTSKIVTIILRCGVVLMPIGFLLGGIWHYESDPGVGIWLVPVAAVMVVFGIVSLAIALIARK
jgi:vacuolar-type H+-ATPase subunit I/STV1